MIFLINSFWRTLTAVVVLFVIDGQIDISLGMSIILGITSIIYIFEPWYNEHRISKLENGKRRIRKKN